jgi:hypothetical protein
MTVNPSIAFSGRSSQNVLARHSSEEEAMAIINGTDGDDFLNGTSGNDTIFGLDGNDTITGNGGDDTIDGGAGIDLARYTNATGGITANLTTGIVSGAGVGTDTLTGIEQVRGSNFADAYIATGFNQGTSPAPGTLPLFNDFEGMGGNDFIDGRGGFDRAVYGNNSAITTGITVNLAAGIVTGDAAVGTDTLRSIESVMRVMTTCRAMRATTRWTEAPAMIGWSAASAMIRWWAGSAVIISLETTALISSNTPPSRSRRTS